AGDAGQPSISARPLLAGTATEHAMAGTTHPPELFDVDVDELARMAALVAVERLGRLETRALAKPDPLQPQRDSRERDPEHLGDLRCGHPQATQPLDRMHPLRRHPRRRAARPRRTSN